MASIRIAFGRVYNVSGCTTEPSENVALSFKFGDITVRVGIGPVLAHIVLAVQVGPPHKQGSDPLEIATREGPSSYPASDRFPAGTYMEIVASRFTEVDSQVAEDFAARKGSAKSELLGRAQGDASLVNAVNVVAGILAMRCHASLVHLPVVDQCYAYQADGRRYSISRTFPLSIGPAWTFDSTAPALTRVLARPLRQGWTVDKASIVFDWMLRAWAASDDVLKFLAMFIALERVLPASKSLFESFNANKVALVAAIKNTANSTAPELTAFVESLRAPNVPLAARFAQTDPPTEDALTFERLNKRRNSLLHQGAGTNAPFVFVGAEELRALEGLVVRCVARVLFGDSEVSIFGEELRREEELTGESA